MIFVFPFYDLLLLLMGMASVYNEDEISNLSAIFYIVIAMIVKKFRSKKLRHSFVPFFTGEITSILVVISETIRIM